jgi:hypothetical protein
MNNAFDTESDNDFLTMASPSQFGLFSFLHRMGLRTDFDLIIVVFSAHYSPHTLRVLRFNRAVTNIGCANSAFIEPACGGQMRQTASVWRGNLSAGEHHFKQEESQ